MSAPLAPPTAVRVAAVALKTSRCKNVGVVLLRLPPPVPFDVFPNPPQEFHLDI